MAMALSLAKKARSPSTIGSSRICSDRRSGENKCDNSILLTEGRICTTKPICHGGG